MKRTAGTRTPQTAGPPAGRCQVLAVIAACCLATAAPALADTPSVKPAPADADTATSGTPQAYVSVIGAVAGPATFASRHSPILLGELFDGAGGFPRQASGTIRIFLRGRLEQEFSYDSSRRIMEVVTGSVIVVDSTTSRPHEGVGQPSHYCDIACLNLLDRPVVRRMSPDESTLSELLKSFGQSDALAATVRVLRKSRMVAGDSSRLNSGDVLVFNPSFVDQVALQSALERMPLHDVQPLDTDFTDAAGRGDPVETAGTAHTVSQIETVAADAVDPVPEPRRALLEFVSTDPAGEPVPAPPMEPAAERNRILAPSIGAAIETVAEPETAATARSYPGADAPRPESAPNPPAETAADSRLTHSLAAADTSASPAMGPPVARSVPDSRATSGLMAAAITAGLCLCVGFTVLSVWSSRDRKRRVQELVASRAPEPPQAVEPPPAPDEQPLDDMINDTLPLVEEAPTFPAQMLLHGRTLGFRYLLLSGPHGLDGPHFAAAQVSARLRDQAGMMRARTSTRTDGRVLTPPPLVGAGDEPPITAQAAASELAQPEPGDRTAGKGRHHPSPLERALLARRGRNRP